MSWEQIILSKRIHLAQHSALIAEILNFPSSASYILCETSLPEGIEFIGVDDETLLKFSGPSSGVCMDTLDAIDRALLDINAKIAKSNRNLNSVTKVRFLSNRGCDTL